MFYLPDKLLNKDPRISIEESYQLAIALEGFRNKINFEKEKAENQSKKKETIAPAQELPTQQDFDNLLNILVDLESKLKQGGKNLVTKSQLLKAQNILSQNPEQLAGLSNLLAKKNIDSRGIKLFLNTLSSEFNPEVINTLVNYLNSPSQLTLENVITSGGPKNVTEIFSQEKTGLHPEMVTRLFRMKLDTGGGKQVGEGELGLILLVNGATHGALGDVEIGAIKIEVKQGKGLEAYDDKKSDAGRLISSTNIYGNAAIGFKKNFKDIFEPVLNQLNNSMPPGFETSNWYNLNAKNFLIFRNAISTAYNYYVSTNGPSIINDFRNQVVTAYANSIHVYLNNSANIDYNSLKGEINNCFNEHGIPVDLAALVRVTFKYSFILYQSIENFAYFAVYRDGLLLLQNPSECVDSIDKGIIRAIPAGVPTFGISTPRANAFKVTI